ncbi:MAG: hypothetical protein H7Y20_12655 [Bryobacteraceae bacterium]|nr:hypothetical protein [Bryobacteraceae bacterium]
MKLYNSAICVLVLLAGIAVSFMLIPGSSDIGLMRLRDRHLTSARTILESRLKETGYSFDVVMPLVEVYLQYGETDRAIALLDEYSKRTEFSDDLATEKGHLKQLAQRPAEYIKALAHQTSQKPTGPRLRELANLYRLVDQRETLITTLEALSQRGDAKPAEALELAQLYAANANPEAALRALGSISTMADDEKVVELSVRLLLDTGKASEALRRAKHLVQLRNDPQVAAHYAYMFAHAGQPQTGFQLLQPFTAHLRNPDFLRTWVGLEMVAGRKDAAWSRLDTLNSERKLPEQLLEPFLDLAMSRGQLDKALEAGQTFGYRKVPEWLLGNMTDAALEHKKFLQLNQLLQVAGSSFLASRPLTGARIEIANGNPALAGSWLSRAAQQTDSNGKLTVASMFLQLGNDTEARRVLQNTSVSQVAGDSADLFAELFLRLKAASDGADRLAAEGADRPGHRLFVPWVMLATAAGREAPVLKLASSGALAWWTDQRWRDLYSLASDHNCRRLAVVVARELSLRDPGTDSRIVLARALSAAGEYSAALDQFRSLRRSAPPGIDLEADYVSNLLAAAGEAPAQAPEAIRRELAKLWIAKLQAAEPTDRMDAVYGLLSLKEWTAVLPTLQAVALQDSQMLTLFVETADHAGKPEMARAALRTRLESSSQNDDDYERLLFSYIDRAGRPAAAPFIRKLAEAGKEEWAGVHADLLESSSQPDEARAFLRSRSLRSDVTAAEQLRLGYRLLALKDNEAAAKALFQAARKSPADDQAVGDLVQLWGDHAPVEGLAWIETRASEASGDDRAMWLEHLLLLNGAKSAMGILDRKLDSKQGNPTSRILDVYIRAALATGDKTRAITLIGQAAARASAPDQFRVLADAAIKADDLLLATTMFGKLLDRKEHDLDSLRWLAGWAAGHGDLPKALKLYSRLESLKDKDPRSLFGHAEVLRQTGDPVAAADGYRDILRLLDIARNKIRSEEVDLSLIRAHCLFRTGDREGASALYRKVLATGPPNPDTRADFASLLIEAGQSGEAWAVLRARSGSHERHLRSRLLEASILTSQRQPTQALALLESSLDDAGDRQPQMASQILAQMASAEESLGRYRNSFLHMDQASRLDPSNGDLIAARQHMASLNGSRIGINTEKRSIPGIQEQTWSHLDGIARITDALSVVFASNLVGWSGSPVGAASGSRQEGDLGLQATFENGISARALVVSAGDSPGVTGSISIPDSHGRTEIRADYARPWWETAEMLAGGGTRSALEVQRSLNLNPATSLTGVAGIREYTNPATGQKMSTAALTGGLSQSLWKRGLISAQYYFDLEKVLKESPGLNPSGTQPAGPQLPGLMTDREVHAAAIASHANFGKNWSASGSFGIAVDRLGGRGPFWAGELKYTQPRHFSAGLFVDRRRYTQETTKTSTRWGGQLIWQF